MEMYIQANRCVFVYEEKGENNFALKKNWLVIHKA